MISKSFRDAAVASSNAITAALPRHAKFDARILTALAGMGQAWAGETLGRLEYPVPVACVQALGAAFVTCAHNWHAEWARAGDVPDSMHSGALSEWDDLNHAQIVDQSRAKWDTGSMDFWAVYARPGFVYLAVNTSQPEPSKAESVIVVGFRPVF